MFEKIIVLKFAEGSQKNVFSRALLKQNQVPSLPLITILKTNSATYISCEDCKTF